MQRIWRIRGKGLYSRCPKLLVSRLLTEVCDIDGRVSGLSFLVAASPTTQLC